MKFSIIIPVYNTGTLVKEVIDVLMTQKNRVYEVICIDDGSTDDSYNQLLNLKEKYNEIIVFSKENGGLSSTRNFGIKVSNGEYLIFLDSDDMLNMNEFKKILSLCHSDVDIVHGNFSYTFEDTDEYVKNKEQIIMSGSGQDIFNASLLQDKMSMIACANIYRKQFLLDHNLFFKEGIYHEDEEFNLRAFSYAKRVESTNIYFYEYLQRSNSITNSTLTLEKRFNDIIDIHKGIHEFLMKSQHINQSYIDTCLTYISFMVIFGYCRLKDKTISRKYYPQIKFLQLNKKINSKIPLYWISKYALNICPRLFLKSFSQLINYRNKKLKIK